MATLLQAIQTVAQEMPAHLFQGHAGRFPSRIGGHHDTGDDHPFRLSEHRHLIDVHDEPVGAASHVLHSQKPAGVDVLYDEGLRNRSLMLGDVHDCLPRASFGAVQGKHTPNYSPAKVGTSPSSGEFLHGYGPVNAPLFHALRRFQAKPARNEYGSSEKMFRHRDAAA